MKDLSSSLRRKLRAIAELRFQAIPELFDKRGSMIAAIHPEISDKFPHWQTDIGSITFLDNAAQPSCEFQISLKKVAIIMEDPGSVQEFLDKGMKYLGLMYGQIGAEINKLERFGVRLVEVFAPPGTSTFDDLVRKVSSDFLKVPSDLTVRPKDIMVNVIHDKGMYFVGPVRKGETWIQQMFKLPEANVPAVGIGIDIDSYVTNVEIKKRDDLLRTFQSVFELSKAVEESLLRHQGLLNGK